VTNRTAEHTVTMPCASPCGSSGPGTDLTKEVTPSRLPGQRNFNGLKGLVNHMVNKGVNDAESDWLALVRRGIVLNR